eukprot:8778561-Prorocentrum_lima.AAC.1
MPSYPPGGAWFAVLGAASLISALPPFVVAARTLSCMWRRADLVATLNRTAVAPSDAASVLE